MSSRALTETDNKVLQKGIEGISFDETGLVQIKTMEAALAWGQAMIESGFAPNSFTRPAQVLFACQKGAELGLKPTASLSGFYPAPGGLLGIKVELALAILRGRGILQEPGKGAFVYEGEEGKASRTCVWTFRRRDWERDRWERSSFSLREANRAGLVKPKSGWENYPDRMLKARAIGFAVKDYFSDVLFGVEVGVDASGGDQPSSPPPAGPGLRREAQEKEGPVEDPFLKDVIDVESKPVEAKASIFGADDEISEEDAMAAFEELAKDAHARSEGDPDAQRQIIQHLTKVYEKDGIRAAQKALREHEVFGDEPGPATTEG